jgi:hypothetical protein
MPPAIKFERTHALTMNRNSTLLFAHNSERPAATNFYDQVATPLVPDAPAAF